MTCLNPSVVKLIAEQTLLTWVFLLTRHCNISQLMYVIFASIGRIAGWLYRIPLNNRKTSVSVGGRNRRQGCNGRDETATLRLWSRELPAEGAYRESEGGGACAREGREWRGVAVVRFVLSSRRQEQEEHDIRPLPLPPPASSCLRLCAIKRKRRSTRKLDYGGEQSHLFSRPTIRLRRSTAQLPSLPSEADK